MLACGFKWYCWLEIMSFEISLSSDRVTDHPQSSLQLLAINTRQELDYIADIFLLVSKIQITTFAFKLGLGL